MSKRITDYFSNVKSIDWVDVPVINSKSDENDFYSGCVDKAKCNSVHCQHIKEELKLRFQEQSEKLKQVKKALSSCEFIIEKKDAQIATLQKKLEQIPPLEIVPCASQTIQPTQNSPVVEQIPPKTPMNKDELYNSYSSHFSTKNLSELRSYGSDNKEDSSFILTAMRSLYECNFEKLKGD